MNSPRVSRRKRHWEGVYRDKLPTEVSWYQNRPAMSLQLIHNARVSFGDPIIDVGGGASTLVDCLFNEGYERVAVLDVSARALSYAQARFGDKAPGVEWYIEDVTRFRPPHPFVLWHDRAVFHFLSDQRDRRRYVQVLKQSLLPHGNLIIAAFAIGGPVRCSGLDVVQYDAVKLLAELGEEFELVEEKIELHTTPAKSQQKFAWFRLIRSQR